MKTNQNQPKRKLFISGLPVLASFILFVLLADISRAQWNPNTAVNLLMSSYSGDVLLSAPTTDGKTWISFYSLTNGNYAMRAQLLDANGYKLLGPDGIVVSNYASGSAVFVYNMCLDASNNLIIAMQDERTGTRNACMYKIDQNGNHLWSPSGVILGAGLAPNPCVLSTGETVVCWDESVSGTLNLQKVSVANPISTTLWAQGFNNDGTSAFSQVQLSTLASSGARYYSILSDADTTYFGYYVSQGNRFNSYLQRLNPTGTLPYGANGSLFITATGTYDNYQTTTDIGKQAGSNYIFSVVNVCDYNQVNYGIYVQKYLKTTGARQFTDAAKVVIALSSSRDQHAGNIAMITDGPMFMEYNDNSSGPSYNKIWAIRLDASGNFVWPGNKVEISSSTATAGVPKMRYGFTPVGPNRCSGIWTENRGSGYLGYAQGISVGGLVGIKVATQANVPATITLNGGTLQVVDTIFPLLSDQNVTWSIVHGTGLASISAGGLVTALVDGIVYAKAISVQDNTMKDSLLITISGQVPSATTLPATNITLTSVTLNGSVFAKNYLTNVYFSYGLTTAYTNVVTATPFMVSGTASTGVLVNLTGLQPNKIYHYRCQVTSTAGSNLGADMTFSTCNIPGVPGTIGGPAAVCQSQTGVNYSVPPIVNAADYVWTVPNGAVIVNGSGTPNITVNFSGSATSGNVTVTGVSVCASGPTGILPVNVVPIPVPSILGGTSACVNSGNIDYSTEYGMTNYLWNISPGGTITAGAGTNHILVTWTIAGSRWVSVNYSNAGGCSALSPSVLNVSVASQPEPAGVISGPAAVCMGSQNVPYQVNPIPNALLYNWTLPANATIASGSGTTSISVNFAANASPGNIMVNGINLCGSGIASTKNVDINPIPPTPVIIAGGQVLISSSAMGNQWFHNGSTIPGANSQTYHVPISQPGWYWTIVTLNGCPSDSSNHLYVAGVGIGEKNSAGINVYPLPNDGHFNISISSQTEVSYTLSIFNNLGVKIYVDKTISVNGTEVTPVDLGPVPDGLYTLILRGTDNQVVRKILVNR
ncbi:MAG: T9SS type A sorting domain-containing protein [Bacteroidetes bacterium]|nr:T9SS type A sorting domain-containing protein [Bacteroidota bacterium]